MTAEGKPRPVEEIDADIAQVKKELEGARGTDCEVYSRIVGYYRDVRNWNKGKREEFKERKAFRLGEENGTPSCGNETAEGAHKQIDKQIGERKE